MPVRLKHALLAQGHDADTVLDEKLAGQADEKIWRAAQAEGRLLITQDLDFSDMRKFTPGTHGGILLVRLREPAAQALLDKVSAVAGELSNWQGCFVVLTEHKLRVKRP